MATYSVYLCDPFGTRLADASGFVSLKYSRVVNDVGTLTLELPAAFPTQFIRIPDGRIEVWRRIESGREYLDTGTIWLIQKLTYRRDASGNVTIVVEAETPLRVFREPGRFAYGYAGTSVVTLGAGAADDHIKTVATNNIGSGATAARRLSFITIDGNTSQGASIAKAFAWRTCLTVMQELAEASITAGVYVAFDIVSNNASGMTFTTFTGQRGVDHRFPGGYNPVLLSPESGNIGESTLMLDYSGMASAVTVGGGGQGTDRVIASATDTVMQGLSPLGYREYFHNYTNTVDADALTSEAQAMLRELRPRLSYSGRLLDTPDTRYGVHWGWGDYVTVQDYGRSFDCRIEAVTVTVSSGENYETIDAWLRSETYYG